MLRMTTIKSSSGAKKYYLDDYYNEGKNLANYYAGKDKEIGSWGGKLGERLGLTGEVQAKDFIDVCDNINPQTGERLTARDNVNNKRTGIDMTFNASKSVSLAREFGNPEQRDAIFKCHDEAVNETMAEIEDGMLARVRSKNQNHDIETGNLLYLKQTHLTTRPIDGIPDTHLHTHFFVLNATYDASEDKIKAGQFGQIRQDAPYYEALYHSKMADKLQQAGFEIERTKSGFELKGIDRETIEKFSRRTVEIEAIAEEKNITNAKDKSNIGARSRESKRELADNDKIYANWLGRLTPEELRTLYDLKNSNFDGATGKKKNDRSFAAVEYSLKHHLERKSVVTDKEILTTAIKSSIGETSAERIKEAFKNHTGIISVKEDNKSYLTTHEALGEENTLIRNANEFKGRFKPINEQYIFKSDIYSDEQKLAVNTALTSTDGIVVIAGKAGTGKTTIMTAIKDGINESGKELFAFAPTAEASRVVQRKEGFENAETIAKLINDRELQKRLKGSVIWIDEGGLLSNKDMNQVLRIGKEQNARIIITGDTKQHNSVERGDALRVLQKEAGYMPITVNKIHRQKNKTYNEAVRNLSNGDSEKGFKKLEKIGSIIETSDHQERISNIAEDYHKSSYKGKSYKSHKKAKQSKEVLVVSPTHAEGERVTEAIREKLKENNIISNNEREFISLRHLQLTAAEKEKADNYKAGDYLVFHQNVKGIKAGSKLQITAIDGDNIKLTDFAGKQSPKGYIVNIGNANAYNLFASKNIKLSEGDKIRITGNGKTKEGVHLFNGTLYNVKGFDKQGNIKLSNGTTIDKNYASLTHGYVMTSHASQGKTVDKVIISQSSMSFRASSQEQFYVSVSRGREAVSIYTDDKEDLLKAISRSSERRSANELMAANELLNNKTSQVLELNRIDRMKDKFMGAADKLRNAFNKIMENEPNKSNELSRTASIDKGKGR